MRTDKQMMLGTLKGFQGYAMSRFWEAKALTEEIDDREASELTPAETKDFLKRLADLVETLVGMAVTVADELESIPRSDAIGVGNGPLVERSDGGPIGDC